MYVLYYVLTNTPRIISTKVNIQKYDNVYLSNLHGLEASCG